MPSVPSWLPSRAAIAGERARRSSRRLAEIIASLDDPEMPPWPPAADDDPESWRAAHWPPAGRDRLEILQRALYFETMDTVMGALALAVWELRSDEDAVAALLRGCGLPCWPAGASEQQARLFRGDHWGTWENVYYERWWGWAPLPSSERAAAHEQSWRDHLEGEEMNVRAYGECWWRTMSMSDHEHVRAQVEILAGLRLARERAHVESYPRPEIAD